MTGFEIGERIDDLDALYGCRRIVRADAALLGSAVEHFPHELPRLFGRSCARIHEHYVHAAGRGDLHDSASHSACAEHAYDEVSSVSVKRHNALWWIGFSASRSWAPHPAHRVNCGRNRAEATQPGVR